MPSLRSDVDLCHHWSPGVPGRINLQQKAMRAFLERSGFNPYIQIAVTINPTSVHWLNTHSTNHKGAFIEIITIYVIGHSGWFGIMSGLFGHILYADEVATSIGWPLNSGSQMELGFASIGIGLVGFRSSR